MTPKDALFILVFWLFIRKILVIGVKKDYLFLTFI